MAETENAGSFPIMARIEPLVPANLALLWGKPLFPGLVSVGDPAPMLEYTAQIVNRAASRIRAWVCFENDVAVSYVMIAQLTASEPAYLWFGAGPAATMKSCIQLAVYEFHDFFPDSLVICRASVSAVELTALLVDCKLNLFDINESVARFYKVPY